MKISFEKLYRYDRIGEPCALAVTFRQGTVTDSSALAIYDGNRKLQSQTKVTSKYPDGSIRFAHIRFQADLPGNAGKDMELKLEPVSSDGKEDRAIATVCADGTIEIDAGALRFVVGKTDDALYTDLQCEGFATPVEDPVGPVLKNDDGAFRAVYGVWKILENGPLCAIVQSEGTLHSDSSNEQFGLVSTITVYAGKPWMDVALRLVNTTFRRQHIAAWEMELPNACRREDEEEDIFLEGLGAPVYTAQGLAELENVLAEMPVSELRTCVGRSNYKTFFTLGEEGAPVTVIADDKLLVGEANEHFAETFYGTFFGDLTNEKAGVCATIFQAQQNYPKAITAQDSGITVLLVPEGINEVQMEMGMAREQRFQLHFHSREESLAEIDNRSLIYQMPDVPVIAPEEMAASGVFANVFLSRDQFNADVEISLLQKADSHARCYGMMNWGDAPDPGYTQQGRGGGKLVWVNNEYDYPHAMYLMYARTGVRRFFDYANVAAAHWMDVDVCHYSDDPMEVGGQWEHTYSHNGGHILAMSHEWVEGLLDCYHFTGNARAYETALGIGENVLRLLEIERQRQNGESSARETGWALRTLSALYVETGDVKWLEPCDWIVGHFHDWKQEMGGWYSVYTDNTTIRVGFMIAIAIGSLARYYRICHKPEIREMILDAVDDLVENCLLDNGLFYYKELPSLARNGSNTMLLEALAIGYELTGDVQYLQYGLKTFEKALNNINGSLGGGKRQVEDTVISGSGSTKNFAQCFIPLTTYYKALAENHLWN